MRKKAEFIPTLSSVDHITELGIPRCDELK